MIKISLLTNKFKKLSTYDLNSKFIINSAWNMIGTFSSQIISMTAYVFIARVLGKSLYGELGIVLNTTNMLGIFAGLGLGLTATKYIAENKDDSERIGSVLGLIAVISLIASMTMSIFFFLLSRQIADTFLHAPGINSLLRISCILLFFNTITGVQSGVLSGFEKFAEISKNNIVKNILFLLLTILTINRYGNTGILFSLSITTLISAVMFIFPIYTEIRNRKVTFTLSKVLSEYRILVDFSLPAFVSSILVSPVTWLSTVLLVNTPSGYDEMGLLNVAMQWRSIFLYIPTIFLQVSLPMMSAIKNNNDEFSHEFDNVFSLTQGVIAFAVVPLSVLVIFATDLILKIYGKSYSSGTSIFIVMVFSTIIQSIGSVTGIVIQSKGKMWMGLIINFIWGSTLLACVYGLVSKYGALSLSIGYSLAYFILNGISFYYLRRIVKNQDLVKSMIYQMVILALVVLGLLMDSKLRLLLAIPASVASFLVTMVFFANKAVQKLFIELINIKVAQFTK
jgi:O-antigen/teichoic acid export membrane protein